MKVKCTKWLSAFLALLLLSLAAMPVLAAETDPVTTDMQKEVIETRYSAFHKEADQSPTAALNDVTDNSELEALSGGTGEDYHCYWVTDAAGQRIWGDMTAGET